MTEVFISKPKKGFSRRHLTSDALDESRRVKRENIRQWEQTMSDNRALRAERSPAEQIARLDTILGKGIGAVKERARLNAKIQKNTKAPKGSKE